MTNTPPVWNSAAAGLLKQFIESGCGQSFLTNMVAARPALHTQTNDLNSVALRAQLVAGYEQALSQIISLTEPVEKFAEAPELENYPPLDLPDGDPRWAGAPKPPTP
jgi:hypothetical protein